MEHSHTVSGLLTKRAEIVRRIKEAQALFVTLAADLEAVDTTIRLFDPGARIASPAALVHPLKEIAHRGEMSRLVLSALRRASAPMTSLEVARIVMEGRGMDLGNHKQTITFRKRVGACLYQMRARGVARSQNLPTGEYIGWELVREK